MSKPPSHLSLPLETPILTVHCTFCQVSSSKSCYMYTKLALLHLSKVSIGFNLFIYLPGSKFLAQTVDLWAGSERAPTVRPSIVSPTQRSSVCMCVCVWERTLLRPGRSSPAVYRPGLVYSAVGKRGWGFWLKSLTQTQHPSLQLMH